MGEYMILNNYIDFGDNIEIEDALLAIEVNSKMFNHFFNRVMIGKEIEIEVIINSGNEEVDIRYLDDFYTACIIRIFLNKDLKVDSISVYADYSLINSTDFSAVAKIINKFSVQL